MHDRMLFQQHLAPTSPEPLALPIVRASGAQLFDDQGKSYIDLIGGISVCNVGHCHPRVIQAIKEQADRYLHVMVYGEVIQSPQVRYAHLLSRHLPETLNSVYFTNSGAEAVEGAMKLAKRLTNRTEIVACHNSYHGSTQGALSLFGDETWRNAYRPLLPDIRHLSYNDMSAVQQITAATAAVVVEPIQAEAGVKVPDTAWLAALRRRCTEVGALLIFDEIQTGFGRTGTLWAFLGADIVPDVLLLGKALGGGMPLGAFITSAENMYSLAHQPILGHMTTFGGHPVSCAAGMAAMQALLDEQMMDGIGAKEALFHTGLQHPAVKEIRSKGLMMAVALEDFSSVQKAIRYCVTQKPAYGVFTDWFLFAPDCLRIAPPLTISATEIKQACALLCAAFDQL